MTTTTINERPGQQDGIVSRPILFSSPMVRAILSGSKTMTRRVVKFEKHGFTQPLPHVEYARDGMPIWWSSPPSDKIRASDYYDNGFPCPYGRVGDRLWVRETWSPIPEMRPSGYFTDPKWINRAVWYAADNDKPTWGGSWRPSIFMRREVSRITLEVTGIRVERLTEITEEDAIAEGAQCAGFPASLTNRGAFARLWEKINGADSWSANPWVWVVEFKRITD